MVSSQCGLYRSEVLMLFKQKTADEIRISDWSSDVCSSDLVDVLSLGMLTCIRKSFDLINTFDPAEEARPKLTLETVPFEDPAVYEMLCKGDSIGVFQVESRAQINMLPRLKPKKFYDLVIQVAIVRPGPIEGDMVHPYLRRRQEKEKVVYPSPAPPDRKSVV